MGAESIICGLCRLKCGWLNGKVSPRVVMLLMENYRVLFKRCFRCFRNIYGSSSSTKGLDSFPRRHYRSSREDTIVSPVHGRPDSKMSMEDFVRE